MRMTFQRYSVTEGTSRRTSRPTAARPSGREKEWVGLIEGLSRHHRLVDQNLPHFGNELTSFFVQDLHTSAQFEAGDV